jgi:PAS domain S-box-containing protein
VRRFHFRAWSHLLRLWLIGVVGLTAATWICFTLHANAATTGFVYLVIVIVLSLWDSFVTSAVFSLAAVGLLNYFFIEPLFSLNVDSASDVVALATFVLTSFVITSLVRRVRRSGETLERQARLLELTHDTVIVRDANDVITFWNRGAESLYGWSREEAVGVVSHNLLRTRFPEDRTAIIETVRRDGHWEGELVRKRKDGTEVIVASRWSSQRDDLGQSVGTLETSNDITQRRRAEEALARSQAAYLAEAQKLSLTGSFGWNADGAVFWSEQTFIILGYEAAETPSIAHMLGRVHADEREAVGQAIGAVSRDGGLDIEFRLALPDGATRHVHAIGHMLRADGDPAQFVGALTDVTVTKLAEARLQEAQTQVAHVARVTSLGALSASIAHEVNQPLVAITSHGEASLRWLNRDVPRLNEVEASIRHVISNARRASEIIQRVRSLTTNVGRQQGEVDLNVLIGDVMPLVRHEMARHRVRARLALSPMLPPVPGDPIRLQQVVINLIVNGVQAMSTVEDRERELVLATHADDSHVILDVQDSGPGVEPAIAERIFETFFTTKPGGMGIGLSICRSIVEAHGGRLISLRRDPEPGATFRCILPVKEIA